MILRNSIKDNNKVIKKKELGRKISNFSIFDIDTFLYLNFLIGSLVKNGKKNKVISKFFNLEELFRQKYKVNLIRVFYFCFQLMRVLLTYRARNFGRRQVRLAFWPRNFFRDEGRRAARLMVNNIKVRKERTLLLKLFAEISDILVGGGIGPISEYKKDLYLTLLDNRHYIRYLKFSKFPREAYKVKL